MTDLLIAAVAILVGVGVENIAWRALPANVSAKELIALRVLWANGPSGAAEVVSRSERRLSHWRIYAVLGDLSMRGLATSDISSGSEARWTITTEGIQVCALNDQLLRCAA